MPVELVTSKCPIKPEHIDTSRHFSNAFGNNETEVSAYWIVRMCQERGNWEAFTREEIEAFYNEGGHKDFWFNKLITGNWIHEHDGEYYITVKFVANCWAAAPEVR